MNAKRPVFLNSLSLRPTSALPNLQTHPKFASTSLYDDGRRHDGDLRRPKTGAAAAAVPAAAAGAAERPKSERRLTVTGMEALDEAADAVAAATAAANRRRATHAKSSQMGVRIEERISVDTFEELQRAFASADVDDNGQLNLKQFKAILKEELKLSSREPQIDSLFQRIDCWSSGKITWDQFCTYMQLEYAEIEDSRLRLKEVTFAFPAVVSPSMPHREPVLRIVDMPDGSFIAGSQDGLISFWTANMILKKTKSVAPPDAVQKSHPKWITDFVLMSNFNKIITGTGDRELQFFELSTFEPYCQIRNLETVPLTLDYYCNGNDECLLMFGDCDGCINVLFLYSAGESLRMWKKSPTKADGVASISFEQMANSAKTRFYRWKVHGDWVQKLRYYDHIGQIVSCSNSENTAVVIGSLAGSTQVDEQLREIRETHDPSRPRNQQQPCTVPKSRPDADQSVFRVYKGVKCFDFSKTKNVLVTGGMDRIVRLWNPYVTNKPIGLLSGHVAPICYLTIVDDEERIFSVSMDRCVRIWDVNDQNCLLTVRPKVHRMRGEIQACFYSTVSKTLAVASEKMNGLQLKLQSVKQTDVPLTHRDPVRSVVYDPRLKQIITASDGSVVKLWDLVSGAKKFEFGNAHSDHAVTCMTLDDSGRRVMTGGRDGIVRVWNYNNGHCLKVMGKETENAEICALNYMLLNNNRFVITVGWDKRINMYLDSLGDSHRVQRPLPTWKDDIEAGHRDDILSVALCPPNLLASSSYDGEVIVWSTISGHIHCHLNASLPDDLQVTNSTDDLDTVINKVVFLRTRRETSGAASLAASGPFGRVHLWSLSKGGRLLGRFPTSNIKETAVTSMDVEGANSYLVTGDNFGFICVWNIGSYAVEKAETESPTLLAKWRGHLETVTCFALVEDMKMILSSALDCTVRLWTLNGHYVGVFGQSDLWDIYTPATFQHPMVPYDVLIDPLSIPVHPILQKPHLDDAPAGGNPENNEVKDVQESTPPSGLTQGHELPDDIIASFVNNPAIFNGQGKRLRHERMKPRKADQGRPSDYQMLRCYRLDSTSQPESPKIIQRNKRNSVHHLHGREEITSQD